MCKTSFPASLSRVQNPRRVTQRGGNRCVPWFGFRVIQCQHGNLEIILPWFNYTRQSVSVLLEFKGSDSCFVASSILPWRFRPRSRSIDTNSALRSMLIEPPSIQSIHHSKPHIPLTLMSRLQPRSSLNHALDTSNHVLCLQNVCTSRLLT